MRHHGSIQIVDEEAAIVRTVFALQAQGLGDQQITTVLNARGYHRRNGQRWIPRQVGKILRRHALYTAGVVHYGKSVGQNQALILLP
jgi:hypothetical protein